MSDYKSPNGSEEHHQLIINRSSTWYSSDMRMFVTLCTLLAVAQAKPQGYNYSSGVSGTLTTTGSSGQASSILTPPSNSHNVATYGPLGAFQSASVGSLVSGGSSSRGGSSLQYGSSAPAASSTYTQGGASGQYSSGYGSGNANYGSGQSSSAYGGQGASNYGGGQSSTVYGGGAGSSFAGFGPSPNIGFGVLAGYQAPSYQQQEQEEQRAAFEAPIIHKQFITVAAPEEHESLERVKHLVIGRPQKTYRVVFIKAPSSSSANVKLSAEYAPKEEKTVIYVLSKKDSTLEVNDIATPAPTVPSKPEVFFIKYKTEAEASHAQQQIQAEYDRIEGTSEHTDGGVAPAQSVVGILDAGSRGSSSTTSSVATSGGSIGVGSSGSHNVISSGGGSAGSLHHSGGLGGIISSGGSSSRGSSSTTSSLATSGGSIGVGSSGSHNVISSGGGSAGSLHHSGGLGAIISSGGSSSRGSSSGASSSGGSRSGGSSSSGSSSSGGSLIVGSGSTSIHRSGQSSTYLPPSH